MEKFPESKLAHHYLDGLSGLEIGGSAHNPFGLNTKNVDFTTDETVFKKEELEKTGECAKVDIVAFGDAIPVPDGSQDFVISSHVLEHFPDPIGALKEWYRVIRPGGFIFMIVPHKERTFDRNKRRTGLEELQKRHETKVFPKSKSNHYSFWTTSDMLDLIRAIDLEWKVVDFQDVDDKVGNGFAVVVKKEKQDEARDREINSRINTFKERIEKENKFPALIFKKGKRFLEIAKNTVAEFRRGGIGGVWHRVKFMYKWDKK